MAGALLPAVKPIRHPCGASSPKDPPVETILEQIRRRFYCAQGASQPQGAGRFHRDRRMLIYAVSWPAVWMRQRALTCSPDRYQALIIERLEAIAAYGDPARFDPCTAHAYFPAYLLKCLQDWFTHHGDELYDELKHLRNAIDKILASPAFAARARQQAGQINLIAAAHQLVRPKPKAPKASGPAQLTLF
jgi:hypothetical protein